MYVIFEQEGVMDNLLDALQKGTAFNVRDGGRKRTPRTTGGELLVLYSYWSTLSTVYHHINTCWSVHMSCRYQWLPCLSVCIYFIL